MVSHYYFERCMMDASERDPDATSYTTPYRWEDSHCEYPSPSKSIKTAEELQGIVEELQGFAEDLLRIC